MAHILYVEDERELGQWIKPDLERRGHQVTWVEQGEEALPRLGDVDVVVLDVMLPGLDGFTVGQRMKRLRPELPILLLTARTALEDKLEGLAFADDYLTKPFHPDELAARVDVLLRRYGREPSQPVQVQHLDVYLQEGRVVDRETGEEIHLTGKEFQLLAFFLRHPNQVLTREQLYEAVWGEPFVGADNTLMVHIRHLREKLERDPGTPSVIQTIRGLGYRLKR
jgi:DNA-binding response OmpR family regulator